MLKNKDIADPSVEPFHSQFNAKQFSEIYDQADEEFKKSVTKEELTELLTAVHRKLGTVVKSSKTSWHVNSTPFGSTVSLSYDVEFSEGKGTEQFVYSVRGDKASLYN